MTQAVLHAPPRPRDVLREQVRAVGIALRQPAAAAAALAGVGTLLVVAERVAGGGPVDFAPELSMIPGVVGAVFPAAVWKGEQRFGPAFLWMLPVDRRHHALAKVGAGWLWLMATVAAFVLWLLALAFFTGGDILAEQTVRVLPSTVVPAPGTLDPAALRVVRWAPGPVLWLVPFTAATGAYLLASAVALGSRHALRWLVGSFLLAVLVSALGAAARVEPVKLGPARVVETVYFGPYGVDALLTARTESLHAQATLTTGKTVTVWRALPNLGHWAAATLLWTGGGLVALWAAASRHRERRRG